MSVRRLAGGASHIDAGLARFREAGSVRLRLAGRPQIEEEEEGRGRKVPRLVFRLQLSNTVPAAEQSATVPPRLQLSIFVPAAEHVSYYGYVEEDTGSGSVSIGEDRVELLVPERVGVLVPERIDADRDDAEGVDTVLS